MRAQALESSGVSAVQGSTYIRKPKTLLAHLVSPLGTRCEGAAAAPRHPSAPAPQNRRGVGQVNAEFFVTHFVYFPAMEVLAQAGHSNSRRAGNGRARHRTS